MFGNAHTNTVPQENIAAARLAEYRSRQHLPKLRLELDEYRPDRGATSVNIIEATE